MIKNVIFDIGNVLIGFDCMSYLDRLFDEETASKVAKALFLSGHWVELDRAVLTEGEIMDLFYSIEPEVKAEIREAYARIGECVSKCDWVTEMIDALRQRGYNVYFLSNMSEHVLDSNPDAFAFTDHMDGGVFSCDVKLVKPDPGIYRSLLDKYRLVPEECLFIDDLPANISAAKRLGFKGIVFRDREQMLRDMDKALTKDASHSMITVLCYGDSNTYGYDPQTGGRYPHEKRWTTVLGDMLGDRYEVINEGLNGRTTAYDRPGAAWKNGISSFISCLGTHKPVDIVTIMLGTNDCNAGLGLTAEQIADGMETLVRLTEENAPDLQGYIPRIIVIAPAAIGEDYGNSPFAYELSPGSVRKSHDIGPLYEELARRHDCDFISAVDAAHVSELDSMHLSEKGPRQLAKKIAELLCKNVAC